VDSRLERGQALLYFRTGFWGIVWTAGRFGYNAIFALLEVFGG